MVYKETKDHRVLPETRVIKEYKVLRGWELKDSRVNKAPKVQMVFKEYKALRGWELKDSRANKDPKV